MLAWLVLYWIISYHVTLQQFLLISTTEQLPGVVQKLAYRVLDSAFPRVHLGRLSACTCMPQREGNSMLKPPVFNPGT